MAKARNILSRLSAVRNVRTVTAAMEAVASSRFKKAHNQATAVRPYTARLIAMVIDVLHRSGTRLSHPFLDVDQTVERDVLLVLTGNRGLCGGYNSGVVEMAIERKRQLVSGGHEVLLHVVGKKGVQLLKSRKVHIDREYTQFGYLPDYADTCSLADELIDTCLAGQIGALEVAYMQYVSPGTQSPAIAQLMPLAPDPPTDPETRGPASLDEEIEYDFIPSAQQILDRLLPASVRLRLYQCFLDAAVGEQIARITAMRAGTENADDMIRDLTRRYNRLRQGQITTELAEILGGRGDYH